MIVLYVAAAIVCAIVGVLALNLLFLFVLSLFAKNKDYEKANGFYRAVFLFYLRVAMFFCRVKIRVTGREKIADINGKFLIVGNHRSNFDPFVTAVGLKIKELAFISKPENFRVPLFGKIVRKCLYTDIDRENARNAFKTINRTAELIKSGEVSYCVFPEGTRSKNNSLLPFHDGVFKIAQKASAPVVVIAIRGAEKIRKRAPWRKTVVYIDVAEIIGADKTTSLSSHEMAGIARETLLSATEGN